MRGGDREGCRYGFGLFEFKEAGGALVFENVVGFFEFALGLGGPVLHHAILVAGDDAVVFVVEGHEVDYAPVEVLDGVQGFRIVPSAVVNDDMGVDDIRYRQ